MALSIAAGKRQRRELLAQVARELKAKDRAKLLELRAHVRALRAKERSDLAAAIRACRQSRRQLPSQAELAAALRAAKRAARSQCALDLKAARALRDEHARARAELGAEKKFQADLRRIERGNRAKLAAQKKRRGPGIAGGPRGESDQEVEGNIPPELVALWRRVRREIKGSDRKSRTEAFLQYAEAHPDEEWIALEDSVDRAVAEMERRQAMPNPKKKKKRAKKNPPHLTAAQSRKRFADLKKAGCKPKRIRLGGQSVVVRRKACAAPPMPNPRKRPPAGSIKQGDLFMAPSGQLVLVEPSHEQRLATRKTSAAARTRDMFEHAKKNPRWPPKRWWDRCLRSVTAKKYARDPAAVCAAAWWRRPAAERERIVRRFERGSPKERRAAVMIAKAEAAHADGPPRRNPAMTDAQAAREYRRTHWGNRGHGKVRQARAADPTRGTAAQMGTLVSVVYRTKKRGDKKLQDYEHAFERPLPRLLYNEGGLFIAGGDYLVKTGGITG